MCVSYSVLPQAVMTTNTSTKQKGTLLYDYVAAPQSTCIFVYVLLKFALEGVSRIGNPTLACHCASITWVYKRNICMVIKSKVLAVE